VKLPDFLRLLVDPLLDLGLNFLKQLLHLLFGDFERRRRRGFHDVVARAHAKSAGAEAVFGLLGRG
jgi:hypothetical protein